MNVVLYIGENGHIKEIGVVVDDKNLEDRTTDIDDL